MGKRERRTLAASVYVALDSLHPFFNSGLPSYREGEKKKEKREKGNH